MYIWEAETETHSLYAAYLANKTDSDLHTVLPTL